MPRGLAIDRLGIRTDGAPRHRDYDRVLALGGLIHACFIRPAHAGHLMRNDLVRSASFIGLGGHRPFSDDERRLAGLAGLNELDSEFSALDAGVRTAFDVTVARAPAHTRRTRWAAVGRCMSTRPTVSN